MCFSRSGTRRVRPAEPPKYASEPDAATADYHSLFDEKLISYVGAAQNTPEELLSSYSCARYVCLCSLHR